MKKEQPKLKLNKEQETEAVQAIIDYFDRERDETIGNLDASFLYDFFIETIGPAVYDKGLLDAQKFMSEKVDDLYGLQLQKGR